MNIAPVSFGSTPASFSEMVHAPQKYAQKEVPAAATSLSKSHKKESSFGKKILKLAVAAGIVAAGLAIGAKKGIFKTDKIKNETLQKALDKLQKAGEKIGEKATIYFNNAKTKLSELKDNIVKKAPEAAEGLSETVWKQQADFKTAVNEHTDLTQKAVKLADEALSIVQK